MIDLQTHHAECWRALTEAQRTALLDAGRPIVSHWEADLVTKLQAERRAFPEGWMSPYHFFSGMLFRNDLRRAGIQDIYLPTGNLDDYYVTVIEKLLDERTTGRDLLDGPSVTGQGL